MREFFGVLFLVSLNVTSLLLSAVGSAFGSAGSAFHVLFLRKATRHDLKYGLTEEETTAVATANAATSQVKRATGIQAN